MKETNKRKKLKEIILRKNNERGITLIALIVTIIVLLILAGVTIATLMGDNGVLTRANNASVAQIEGQVREEISLAIQAVKLYTEEKSTQSAGWYANKNIGDSSTETEYDNLDIAQRATIIGQLRYDLTVEKGYTIISNEGTGVRVTYQTDAYKKATNNANAKIETIIVIENNTFTIGVLPGQRVEETKVNNYTDGIDVATVPAGFTVSKIPTENIIDDGLVVYDIPAADLPIADWEADEDGNNIIDVQEKYNQFVWVPVSRENFETEFVREHFGTAGQKWWTGSFVTDSMSANNMYESTPSSLEGTTQKTAEEVTKMYKSVQTNGGFYIARYEAGIETTGTGARGIPESKRGMTVYNKIGWSNSSTMTVETGGAVEVSRQMYEGKSTLCYGVQWDAIMRWISNDEDLSQYLTNSSGKGNYLDSDDTNNPAKTGAVEEYQLKNIFDIAGNVLEWTMEAYKTSGRVSRGGSYYLSPSGYPVDSRNYNNPNASSDNNIGFRPTLFV